MNKMLTTKEMSAWIEETWEKCQKEAWGKSEMTREDIIRMAREAGYQPLNPDAIFDCLQEVFFERFAELVAADWFERGKAAFMEAVESERERCAKVCEEIEMNAHALWNRTADPEAQGRGIGAADCAAAIRALK